MKFKDHFFGHAANYAKFRPNYPRELFEYLASIAPGRGRAWDCATGNGQAAVGLSAFFECVIATDASEKQILGASRSERIEFRVAAAEKSGLESKSIDLVTVAQALHWFDLNAFYAEVIRVLKPRGILAAWCYGPATGRFGLPSTSWSPQCLPCKLIGRLRSSLDICEPGLRLRHSS